MNKPHHAFDVSIPATREDRLRFVVCGSVDDGKSTLIDRLLYDDAMMLHEHPAEIERDSRQDRSTGDR
jgi:sulfate adenylyltransferase subunit 1 (EFTu-like GTPase family)